MLRLIFYRNSLRFHIPLAVEIFWARSIERITPTAKRPVYNIEITLHSSCDSEEFIEYRI